LDECAWHENARADKAGHGGVVGLHPNECPSVWYCAGVRLL